MIVVDLQLLTYYYILYGLIICIHVFYIFGVLGILPIFLK